MDNPLGKVNVPGIINNLNNIPPPHDLFWINYLTYGMISPRALERYIQLNKAHQVCTLFKGTKQRHTAKNFILFIKDKKTHCINCTQNHNCDALRLLDELYKRIRFPYASWHQQQENRVSDALNDKLQSWVPAFPIFVFAPTGSGKNWFIRNTLIPYAADRGQAVFIFSNRLALSAQQKRGLAELYDKNKARYTDRQLVNESMFGNCVILNYQSAIRYFKHIGTHKFPPASIGYAVFDEAHFFIADATFNPNTENILYSLQSRFRNAVRIYMTATPTECFWAINEGEATLNYIDLTSLPSSTESTQATWKTRFQYYNFARSFGNYKINFFKDPEQMEKLIKSDLKNPNSNDKWLYFVASKRFGMKLKSSLEEHLENKIVTYLDASLSNDERSQHPAWQAIYEEKCPSRILVSTTVIDNGINLPDSALKNIVVSGYDMVSLFQMIGRKRCAPEETVNLYIAIPTKQQINTYLQSTKKLVNAIDEFLNRRTTKFLQSRWGRLGYNIQGLFYITNRGKLELNYFASYKLHLQLKQYYTWSTMANSANYESAFAQMVLDWFNIQIQELNQFWIESDEQLAAKIALEALLKNHLNTPMLGSYFLNDFYPKVRKLIKDTATSPTAKLPRDGTNRETLFLNDSFSALQLKYTIEGNARPLGRPSSKAKAPRETILIVRLQPN